MASFRHSAAGGQHGLYKGEGSWFGWIARSQLFENFTFAVIFANAVWIAVEVDTNPEEHLINAPPVYQVVEHSFCLFFTLEWLVRFLAYRRKQDCLKDPWFIFDTFLVLLMVAETWVLTVVMLLSGGVAGENLSTLTVLRLLRLMRLTRITRLMRAVPEMMFMIQGLVSAVRSVAITLFLIMIMVYVFAIAFVQLTRDTNVGKELFRGVWPAMVNLAVSAIFPDQDWLLETLGQAGWYYGVLMFIFLVLATLTMVNMLVGILCEVACRVSAREKEIMDIEMVEARLFSIIEESLDNDHDKKISKSEFLGIAKNDKACKALHQVGVEAADLLLHADHIYDDEDEDGSYIERKLDFHEFMQVILKLRGTNAATIRDITNLRKQVKDDISRIERIITGGGTRRGSSCSSTHYFGNYGVSGTYTLPAGTRCKSSPTACTEDKDMPIDAANSDPPESVVSYSPPNRDRIQALTGEVKELGFRMGRLEDLMAKVVEGQSQMLQSMPKDRTLPCGSKQVGLPIPKRDEDFESVSYGPRLMRAAPTVVEGCFRVPFMGNDPPSPKVTSQI